MVDARHMQACDAKKMWTWLMHDDDLNSLHLFMQWLECFKKHIYNIQCMDKTNIFYFATILDSERNYSSHYRACSDSKHSPWTHITQVVVEILWN